MTTLTHRDANVIFAKDPLINKDLTNYAAKTKQIISYHCLLYQFCFSITAFHMVNIVSLLSPTNADKFVVIIY